MSISSDDKYGSLKVADAALTLSVGGYGTVGIQISGTWAGTITFEGSVDGGNWTAIRATPPNSSTEVTTATANGLWLGSIAGLRVIRARMSAYTSGTADVQFLVAGVGGGSSGGGGGSGGTSSDFGDPFPATGTAVGIAAPDGTMAPLSAETFDYDTGAGTVAQTALGLVTAASGGPLPVPGGSGNATGALRVELPTNGTGVIATVGTVTTVSTVTSVTAIANALPVGNNNIGDVDVASLPALPAGTNEIGRVRTAHEPAAANYWDVQAAPAANTLATVSKAAGGGGVRNVCTGFTVTLCGGASAPAAIQLYVMVVDGATTGTTYLWRSAISLPAIAGAMSAIVRTGTWLVGSDDTAMTIEFSAAGGANTVESVTMEGTLL